MSNSQAEQSFVYLDTQRHTHTHTHIYIPLESEIQNLRIYYIKIRMNYSRS